MIKQDDLEDKYKMELKELDKKQAKLDEEIANLKNKRKEIVQEIRKTQSRLFLRQRIVHNGYLKSKKPTKNESI